MCQIYHAAVQLSDAVLQAPIHMLADKTVYHLHFGRAHALSKLSSTGDTLCALGIIASRQLTKGFMKLSANLDL